MKMNVGHFSPKYQNNIHNSTYVCRFSAFDPKMPQLNWFYQANSTFWITLLHIMNTSVIRKWIIQHYCSPNIANPTSNPIAIFLSQIIKNFALWLLPQHLHFFFIFTVKSANLHCISHPEFCFGYANYIMTSSINKFFSMTYFAL